MGRRLGIDVTGGFELENQLKVGVLFMWRMGTATKPYCDIGSPLIRPDRLDHESTSLHNDTVTSRDVLKCHWVRRA